MDAALMIFPPGTLCDHLLRRGLEAVNDAEHVDVEDPAQVVRGDLEQRLDLGDARVGDHDVDGSELADGGPHHAHDGVAIRDVAGHSEAAPSGPRDLVRDRLRGPGVDVIDGDRVPVSGELQGDGPADPAARTRDDGSAHGVLLGVDAGVTPPCVLGHPPATVAPCCRPFRGDLTAGWCMIGVQSLQQGRPRSPHGS